MQRNSRLILQPRPSGQHKKKTGIRRGIISRFVLYSIKSLIKIIWYSFEWRREFASRHCAGHYIFLLANFSRKLWHLSKTCIFIENLLKPNKLKAFKEKLNLFQIFGLDYEDFIVKLSKFCYYEKDKIILGLNCWEKKAEINVWHSSRTLELDWSCFKIYRLGR